jgi:hypothetical protein
VAKKEKPEFYHPCAVMRSILEGIPTDVNAELRSVLQTLLLHLNTGGISKFTEKSEIVVTGQASLKQLELAGYKQASLKKKLNELRRLGHVDWKNRDDNRGRDFFVYATAQENVGKKSVVDPGRSEQGRRAAACRKTYQQCAVSQRADGQHDWQKIDEEGTEQCLFCSETRFRRDALFNGRSTEPKTGDGDFGTASSAFQMEAEDFSESELAALEAKLNRRRNTEAESGDGDSCTACTCFVMEEEDL